MDATQRRSYRKFLQILREKPIVADFMCPIGGRPMTDPVVAEDGYSYERSAIEAWLQDKELSPQTRNLMGSVLEGNSDLKEAIDELKAVLENPPSEELTITWNSPGPTPLQRTLVISPPAETSDSSDWEVLTPTSPAEGQTNGARQRAAQAQDMSYTLSKIFRVLDPLRGLLLEALDGWTPQRMIVVGDESAGKSTILEMLAMLPIFPRKRRFCTRLATHLRLRRNPDVCRTTLSVYTVTPQGDQLEGEAMVVPKENGHLFVQEKMDHLVSELSKGQEGAGSGGIVTRKIIVIEVQGPEVPSIDLVDLPGITSWPKEKAEAVQQIMKKQIRDDEATGNNNMFLAVVPASGDVKPNTNNAMKFIMENQLQDRTVGVFSKCDQTSRSGSDILRALTLNESTKEGESAESLGRIDLQTWVASMLEPPQEFSNNFERLELQRKSEVEFFEKADENFQHVYRQGHAGMRALIANIERSYLKHLNTTWKPNAMRKVLLKEKEVDFQLCMLGLVEDEAARSSLAKEEVERRLGVTSPVTKSVYEDFILHALRKDLAVKVRERLQRYSGSGLTCEGCEQVEEMNLLEKDLLNLISGALDQVGAGLVFPLQKWLYAKSEVVQIPNTELVNVCTKFSDGFSLMHFEKHLSKKELVQKLHSEPILQLCNYSGYLDEIMSKCKQMHLDAGTRIQNKAAQLAANFVNLDGSSDRRMEVTPRLLSKNDEVSKVKLHCNVNQFLGDLMALFLREIPSPKKLQTLHEGVKVGKERPEAEQKLMRLKEEIRKIGVARDGIRRALDIGDEEFDQMRQELEAEAGSADCCLSREGGSSADADTMSSLKVRCNSEASSCELLIPSEASVQDLKELIRKELGEPSERQLKLTSKGDELEDQHSVKDLGIAEVDFLVVDGSQDAALSADAPRLLGALKARGGRGGAKDGKAKSEEEALPPQAAFLLDVSHVPADDLEAMSLELPAVSDLVQKAKSVVGCSTTARTFNVNHGPLHGFIGSLAGLEKFKNDKPQASGAASIVPVGPGGTLAAFCAAGVMTIEDGLRLAKLAEDATAELASSGKKQRAICVTGFKKALVSTLCQQAAAKEDGGVCSIAAFISRDTFFVSGTEPAISSFEKLAKASPGHCEVSTKGELGCCSSLMQTVQEKLNESLDVLLDSLKPPTTAVWMTTEAKILRPRADPVEILEVLKRLLTSPLLFDQCMKAALEDGVREFYHCNATQKMIVENISDEILERHRCDDEF